MEYKSYRFVDGRARWVIVDEDGKIINKNPSKEKLRSLEKEIKKYRPRRLYYNEKDICPNIIDGKICGNKLIPGKAYQEHNKKGELTGRWLCFSCWYKNDYRCRNNTYHDIIKSLSDRRTGNIKPSTNAKGDLFEELTCRWRGVKNLNIENDNYKSPIDHSRDPELGIIQTKGRLYNHINGNWKFDAYREHNRQFNYVVCYCASKDGKYIERIYFFPKKEIIKRTGIGIYKNPTDSWGNPIISWYEKYKVNDEETKKVNEIWKDILNRKKKKIDVS